MTEPMDELVREMVGELDEELRYRFEERAGIIEFDGGEREQSL